MWRLSSPVIRMQVISLSSSSILSTRRTDRVHTHRGSDGKSIPLQPSIILSHMNREIHMLFWDNSIKVFDLGGKFIEQL
ncbi:hypothetical protein LOD99_10434 [Oopsacas minuta]|uniref:Uncharacterized protein n=1 Tax=Oopsacas minuta TaxID=111878 RepID=A0AAV7KJV6_9METZ|nr:hypothetical protein LOD99_10434 [Oopsacas minuta]